LESVPCLRHGGSHPSSLPSVPICAPYHQEKERSQTHLRP
jgi:hypothetical protein